MSMAARAINSRAVSSTSFSGMGRDTCDPPALDYYIAVVLARSALAWSCASPQAQDAARPKRTIRRPSPSESRPIELDATSPITWNAAETYDASSAALTEPAPETAKTAATKAGVHAHMPRSSQE